MSLKILQYNFNTTETLISYVKTGIKAGFPSPADDFKEEKLSIDKLLIKNKEATFFAHAKGDSMIDMGISDNDILVVDRSLEPANNKVAVCFVDGEFTVKRLKVEKDRVLLMPANNKFKPIEVTKDNDFVVWGIVTNVIKTL